MGGFWAGTLHFDELPFVERWKTVWRGLGQPGDTGEYKFAKLQLLRLSAVGAAVLAPCLAVLLLLLLSLVSFREENVPGSPTAIRPELPPTTPLDPLPAPPLPPVADESLPVADLPRVAVDAERTVAYAAPASVVAPTESPRTLPVAASGLRVHALDGLTREVRGRPGLSDTAGVPGGDPHGRPPSGTPRGDAEDAVFRALRWLKKQQQSDGSWPNVRPAMTSFALLAFLGHGELPGRSAEFGDCVQRGLEWMLANQEPDGRFKGRDPHDYSQPIAAYALGEAAMLVRRPDIRYAAERAVEVVLAGQHRDGAWDYNCKQSERRDTSYMGWCVQALKSAKLAKLGDAARLDAAMQSAASAMRGQFGRSSDYGGFGYTGPGTGARDGLTGVGVLSLQLLGAAGERETLSGLRSLDTWTIRWREPDCRSPLYYWYYSTQAAFHAGDAVWARWDRMFAGELIRSQTPDPEGALDAAGRRQPAGYWDSPSASEHHDGRVMDTCLCVLMLEVYYRYLPSYTKLDRESATAGVPRTGIAIQVQGL
jgi:hypothetical protein